MTFGKRTTTVTVPATPRPGARAAVSARTDMATLKRLLTAFARAHDGVFVVDSDLDHPIAPRFEVTCVFPSEKQDEVIAHVRTLFAALPFKANVRDGSALTGEAARALGRLGDVWGERRRVKR